MILSNKFIKATEEYCSYEKFVSAPYLVKKFSIKKLPQECSITIGCAGFYRLWINGKEITKGILAPYISNTDQIVYYDNYDITELLCNGENAVGFILGNGLQNNFGGNIWDFDLFESRSAPKLAFCIEYENIRIEADSSVLCHPSPIYMDDLRSGERYNASKEIVGWCTPDASLKNWCKAIECESPKGEKRICCADAITIQKEIKPVKISFGNLKKFSPRSDTGHSNGQEKIDSREGYIYDFGVNSAGTVRLCIKAHKGQRIELQYGEYVNSKGNLDVGNINFYPDGYSQRDVYICKDGYNEFIPQFTYHGFRYCLVSGITQEQATDNLLSMLVCNSSIKKTGGFECSDKTANTLYNMCCVSDMANFFYFPTDCPHREKNGWTGDAAVSSEHLLMNYDAAASYTEWLRNIRKSQLENGSLPGIIPTTGWGYSWGNGPGWDAALIYIPYFTYKYTGDVNILEENADAIYKYLIYLVSKKKETGTVEFGLGDWCPVGNKMKATLEFTDTITAVNICRKAAFIFDTLGMKDKKSFAEDCETGFIDAIRKNLINHKKCIADKTLCQTSQALALYFGIFTPDEKQKAFDNLLDIIHKNDDYIDFGLFGARVLFHVLTEFGESDLAYKMICRKEWPSYGHFIEQGLTSIPEDFFRRYGRHNSLNHHFYGDISNWFISKVAGLRFNPTGKDVNEVLVAPSFIDKLSFAKAHYDSPNGKIEVSWERTGEEIVIKLSIPEGMKCTVNVNKYQDKKGRNIFDSETGEIRLTKSR